MTRKDPFKREDDNTRVVDAGQTVEEHPGQISEHCVEADLMLDGFKSRWMICSSAAACIPSATCFIECQIRAVLLCVAHKPGVGDPPPLTPPSQGGEKQTLTPPFARG